jgi:hypothetical protein
MDVCEGGTIPGGATSITFTNNHSEPCTITGCKMPGWPPTNPVIPAASNGVPGRLVVQLPLAVPPGSYTYMASCCKGPVTIRFQ